MRFNPLNLHSWLASFSLLSIAHMVWDEGLLARGVQLTLGGDVVHITSVRGWFWLWQFGKHKDFNRRPPNVPFCLLGLATLVRLAWF